MNDQPARFADIFAEQDTLGLLADKPAGPSRSSEEEIVIGQFERSALSSTSTASCPAARRTTAIRAFRNTRSKAISKRSAGITLTDAARHLRPARIAWAGDDDSRTHNDERDPSIR